MGNHDSENQPLAVATAPAPDPTAARRFFFRAKTLGKFVSVQAIAQALGALSGILLVRTLSQREYAFFTIANSMQATMNILADTGLTVGLSSIGGRVWQDPYRFGQLIATTVRLRRYLALISACLVTPVLVWMLVQKGASHLYAGTVGSIVLLGLNFQLITGVLIMVPRLLSQIGRVQLIDLLSAVLRLVLLGVAFLICLNAATAVLASVAIFAGQYLILRSWVRDGIDTKAPVNEEYRSAMLRMTVNQAPTVVFYCLQGQISVWLVGVYGNTKTVAEVGALGRLGIIFVIIGSVMTSIVLPRFTKYHSAQLLRRRYLQIIGAFLVIGALLLVATAWMPNALLWILGSKYALLQRELLLMMILTVVNSIAHTMWALNASKAWIEYSWLNIPATLVAQGLLLTRLDVSTLHGVLVFGIFSVIPTLILNAALTIRGLRATGEPR